MKVSMDCISYLNDLQLEIDILEKIKRENDKDKIDKIIKQKEELIEKCKSNLSQFSINSIEYRLYYKILQGKKPSQAVEEIAEENMQNNIKPSSVNTIWKNYYKKIKKFCKIK